MPTTAAIAMIAATQRIIAVRVTATHAPVARIASSRT